MTHLADGLKSAAPSLIAVSSEEFVELKPSITTLLVSFRIKELVLTKRVRLNLEKSPCEENPSYSFSLCVKESLAKQVQN